jgi:hypothetical protein
VFINESKIGIIIGLPCKSVPIIKIKHPSQLILNKSLYPQARYSTISLQVMAGHHLKQKIEKRGRGMEKMV